MSVPCLCEWLPGLAISPPAAIATAARTNRFSTRVLKEVFILRKYNFLHLQYLTPLQRGVSYWQKMAAFSTRESLGNWTRACPGPRSEPCHRVHLSTLDLAF